MPSNPQSPSLVGLFQALDIERPLDVADTKDVQLYVEGLHLSKPDNVDPIDVLVCNAGYTHRAPLAEWTLADWNAMLAIHASSSFFLAQKVAEPMRRHRHGRIIFTSSITALKGRATIHGYAAGKSALAALARTLAAELGEDGITCNSIAPGYFETDLTQPLLADEAFVARINSRVPLRRWGKPRDLAGVAVLLASAAGSYVTGQQIVIDGGWGLGTAA